MQSAPLIDPQQREDLTKEYGHIADPFFLISDSYFNQVQQELGGLVKQA